jgi:hypothetical protein
MKEEKEKRYEEGEKEMGAYMRSNKNSGRDRRRVKKGRKMKSDRKCRGKNNGDYDKGNR